MVHNWMRQGLDRLVQMSPNHVTVARRAILLAEPPLFDAGELSAKGEIRHAQLLKRHVQAVQLLHAANPGKSVIALDA
ncbi:MAG: hypothetical protein MO853_02910 [Candidatus Protistobacter heckmanni]|nr:hypothetical protein [Candidatus Protistobacter heckmanni]